MATVLSPTKQHALSTSLFDSPSRTVMGDDGASCHQQSTSLSRRPSALADEDDAERLMDCHIHQYLRERGYQDTAAKFLEELPQDVSQSISEAPEVASHFLFDWWATSSSLMGDLFQAFGDRAQVPQHRDSTGCTTSQAKSKGQQRNLTAMAGNQDQQRMYNDHTDATSPDAKANIPLSGSFAPNLPSQVIDYNLSFGPTLDVLPAQTVSSQDAAKMVRPASKRKTASSRPGSRSSASVRVPCTRRRRAQTGDHRGGWDGESQCEADVAPFFAIPTIDPFFSSSQAESACSPRETYASLATSASIPIEPSKAEANMPYATPIRPPCHAPSTSSWSSQSLNEAIMAELVGFASTRPSMIQSMPQGSLVPNQDKPLPQWEDPGAAGLLDNARQHSLPGDWNWQLRPHAIQHSLPWPLTVACADAQRDLSAMSGASDFVTSDPSGSATSMPMSLDSAMLGSGPTHPEPVMSTAVLQPLQLPQAFRIPPPVEEERIGLEDFNWEAALDLSPELELHLSSFTFAAADDPELAQQHQARSRAMEEESLSPLQDRHGDNLLQSREDAFAARRPAHRLTRSESHLGQETSFASWRRMSDTEPLDTVRPQNLSHEADSKDFLMESPKGTRRFAACSESEQKWGAEGSSGSTGTAAVAAQQQGLTCSPQMLDPDQEASLEDQLTYLKPLPSRLENPVQLSDSGAGNGVDTRMSQQTTHTSAPLLMALPLTMPPSASSDFDVASCLRALESARLPFPSPSWGLTNAANSHDAGRRVFGGLRGEGPHQNDRTNEVTIPLLPSMGEHTSTMSADQVGQQASSSFAFLDAAMSQQSCVESSHHVDHAASNGPSRLPSTTDGQVWTPAPSTTTTTTLSSRKLSENTSTNPSLSPKKKSKTMGKRSKVSKSSAKGVCRDEMSARAATFGSASVSGQVNMETDESYSPSMSATCNNERTRLRKNRKNSSVSLGRGSGSGRLRSRSMGTASAASVPFSTAAAAVEGCTKLSLDDEATSVGVPARCVGSGGDTISGAPLPDFISGLGQVRPSSESEETLEEKLQRALEAQERVRDQFAERQQAVLFSRQQQREEEQQQEQEQEQSESE